MSVWTRPEENTLGGILLRHPRTGIPAASTAARAVAHAQAQGASLGTAHLGTGATVLCVIAAAFGVLLFGQQVDRYPNHAPIVAAWVLFVAALATVTVRTRLRGENLPPWLLIIYLAALAAVVTLDFVAIWPLHNIGRDATVSVAAGFGLLLIVTLRPARELYLAASLLFLAFVGAILATTGISLAFLPTQLATLAIAVFPAVFGVFVVSRFRGMVQLELDRVLIKSTVVAPRFMVGMLASAELARLDLAAEELLDSVASGRTLLPLEASIAASAGELATELRRHLIEGRRETWLYHAMLESHQLGTAATLRDPGSLAGLLNPGQRDGLLSAIWLLVADNQKNKSSARLTLGPVLALAEPTAKKTIVVPITITTTGVPRNRIDPSVWAAIERVGVSRESTQSNSLRVDIDCVVPNPAGA